MMSCEQCSLSSADFPEVTQSIVGQTKVSLGNTIGFRQPVRLCLSVLAVTRPCSSLNSWLDCSTLHFLIERT